ncbi:piggyBac transposable element-derived protein 4-like [Pecten maximus]|uniref:piggyBac transposable element-derived protein 4-like n=1 Tax=Pecten maximus TaxID=6579 RepID=UPI0014586CC3|nr:piggyBac transposable element-derived protein 4-like [Pecten maximus]
MSSDTEISGGEDFEGFDPEEVQDTQQNHIAILGCQGTGDDDISVVGEVDSDPHDLEAEVGPGGDADDEWHTGFKYFEGFRFCLHQGFNRRGLQRDIMQKRPEGVLRRGDMAFRQKGPLLAVVWKDKKCVTALSTIHDETTAEVQRLVKQEDGTFVRENFRCLKVIADYTSHIGGVDKADHYMQYYAFSHKSRKWTMKVFFGILEIIKLTAYQLFLQSPSHQPGQGKQQLSFLQCTQSVMRGLVDGFTSTVRKGRPSLLLLDERLTQRHLPGTLQSRSWCHVCYMRCKSGLQDKASQTKFSCIECREHICLPTCFSLYHSQAKYF